VVLNTDEMTLRMPVTDGVNHRLGELHNGPEQRMAFDHSVNQSLTTRRQDKARTDFPTQANPTLSQIV
jgi:hypothetical protein